MPKIVFIIPYFGKFNNYFQLFLNSCKYNPNIDWLIFTDDKENYQYPKNVKVRYITFNDLKIIIQKKFDFSVILERPYKLCDLKPMYGYIFEEDIKEYDFWGHCDTDMIFGDIKHFFSKYDLSKYDKLFFLGHCTLYKNTVENNKIFMRKLGNKLRYKEVLQSPKNHSFDEEFKESINNIYLSLGKSLLLEELEANIYTKSSNFNCTRYNLEKDYYYIDKKKNSFFIFERGKIFQYYLENKKLKKEEFLYIHMQSRKMEIKIPLNKEYYKIIPNAFEEMEYEEVNIENILKIKKKNFNLHYFKLRTKNLIVKIKQKFGIISR